MTIKQENIIKAALKLFAEQGYHATSTNKVAKEAGVSEGLIFRHFTNKEGLLQAIMNLGLEKASKIFVELSEIDEPKKVIRAIIEMPFQISEEEYHFWKLMYAVKWQADAYDNSVSNPIRSLLIDIFNQLKYENAAVEADVLLLILDGILTSVLLKKPKNQAAMIESLCKKYKV